MANSKARVALEGVPDLIRSFERLNLNLDDTMDDIIPQELEVIKEAAKSNLSSGGHVNSGDLKDSIEIEKVKKGKNYVKYSVSIKKFYGVFLEIGTKHQTSQPFLRPAYDKNKTKVLNKIKEKINNLLR